MDTATTGTGRLVASQAEEALFLGGRVSRFWKCVNANCQEAAIENVDLFVTREDAEEDIN